MAKTLRCRVGLHRWHKVYTPEKLLKECRTCGKRIGTGFPPGNRHGSL